MADEKLKYEPKNKKAAALVHAGLMEPPVVRDGGPQPVTATPAKQQQEKSQAG